MRVLYLHQHFTTPEKGGGTRSYELAKRLVARGHSVCVVCGEFAKLDLMPTAQKEISRGIIDGINVIQISLHYSTSDGISKRVRTYLRFALISVRIALREDYDVLFATSTPLTAGVPGIVMKLFRNKKFIFEVRDLWPALPRALGLKNPFLLWGMSILEWLSYRFANACIGLAPGICNGIARRSSKNKKIELVPNACDLDIFKPGKRAELKLDGISDSDTVAVFTGAHGIGNGLDAVLNAAAELRKMGRDNIKLVFIGDGRSKSMLVKRAKLENLNNCIFLPPVSKLQLNKIISNADIGLMILANLPAFYYGTSPNKFFDYVSSGLPVLNNYPGWLADMIQEHQCGIAVPPDDPLAFAKALIHLADNPGLRKTYAENSRQLAEKCFSRQCLGDKFVKFLEEVHYYSSKRAYV